MESENSRTANTAMEWWKQALSFLFVVLLNLQVLRHPSDLISPTDCVVAILEQLVSFNGTIQYEIKRLHSTKKLKVTYHVYS